MKIAIIGAVLSLFICAHSASAQNIKMKNDWITGLPREEIGIKSWPGGKKVAVCFIFYVEHFGFGQGPNFRPDMLTRKPDVVDEGFRQYAVETGVLRVGRIFKEEDVPLSIALNAQYPEQHPDTWKEFRLLVPKAPIIAHGINNTTELLPLEGGVDRQREYILKTLDRIEKETGVRSAGWSSPSVYANADTFSATSAAGLKYSLDSMDSDTLSLLKTNFGPLILIPYPPTTVDMGQYLQRLKEPGEIEQQWIDYVAGLSHEAEKNSNQQATIVAIGIHPFVFGTPNGAEALSHVLKELKGQKLVWLTDVDAIMRLVK